MTASDVSSVALERARQEAKLRGLSLAAVPTDLRKLSSVGHDFDLVLACDNALPHLLSDEEIRAALRECTSCLAPGGGCLLSVRDYAEPGVGSEFHPYGVRESERERHVTPQTQVFRSRYYASSPQRILELMREAGFDRVRRVDSGFYQPVLVGTKPSRR